MNYAKFTVLIRGNNRAIALDVVAISLEAAIADVNQAFGDVEIITVACNFS